MENKKQPKLFTWRQGVIMAVAAVGGLGLNAYRTYKSQGHLDALWFVISAITLVICGAIVFFIARHANRPEKGT